MQTMIAPRTITWTCPSCGTSNATTYDYRFRHTLNEKCLGCRVRIAWTKATDSWRLLYVPDDEGKRRRAAKLAEKRRLSREEKKLKRMVDYINKVYPSVDWTPGDE